MPSSAARPVSEPESARSREEGDGDISDLRLEQALAVRSRRYPRLRARTGADRAAHHLRHLHARGRAGSRRLHQGLARGARRRGQGRHAQRPARDRRDGRRRRRARRSSCTATSTWCPACREQFEPRVEGDRLYRPRRLRHEGRARGDDVRGRATSPTQGGVQRPLRRASPTRSPTRPTPGAPTTSSKRATRATSRSQVSRPTCTSASRPRACSRCGSRCPARGPRLDPVARATTRSEGGRRVPPDRGDAVHARVVRAVRPPVGQPRPDHGRRRDEQGARRAARSTSTSATCRARTPRRSSREIGALPDTDVKVQLHREPAIVARDNPYVHAACREHRRRRRRPSASRSAATAPPTSSASSRPARQASSSARSAPATTAPTSGCRSPRSCATSRRWSSSSHAIPKRLGAAHLRIA